MKSVSSIDLKTLQKHSLIVSCFALVLVSAGFMWLDQRIEAYFMQPQMESVYYYSREITNIGYSSHYLIMALVLFVICKYFSQHIGYLRNNPQIRVALQSWSVFMLRALVVSGIAIQAIKIIVGRQRPHVTEGVHHLNFDPFTLHWHWHSFPSGHTQVLFTVATVLFLVYPRQRFTFFTLATLLAFTRVVTHQHYFSDFIAGALVGYIATLWTHWKWPAIKT